MLAASGVAAHCWYDGFCGNERIGTESWDVLAIAQHE